MHEELKDYKKRNTLYRDIQKDIAQAEYDSETLYTEIEIENENTPSVTLTFYSRTYHRKYYIDIIELKKLIEQAEKIYRIILSERLC